MLPFPAEPGAAVWVENPAQSKGLAQAHGQAPKPDLPTVAVKLSRKSSVL